MRESTYERRTHKLRYCQLLNPIGKVDYVHVDQRQLVDQTRIMKSRHVRELHRQRRRLHQS
jgi:hypothetical protein